MEQHQPAKLEDIISYTPESYFSEAELALIRSHFNGPTGAALLKVIRKALIPTISDPDLPVEEIGKDVFMSAVDFRAMPDAEVKPVALGLQFAMKIVTGSLIQLKVLANVKEETAAEIAARNGKNSAK